MLSEILATIILEISRHVAMIKLFVFLFVIFTLGHGFKIQPRVINGIESIPSDFPFFVSLQALGYRCGGSLISDRYLRTLIRNSGITNVFDRAFVHGEMRKIFVVVDGSLQPPTV